MEVKIPSWKTLGTPRVITPGRLIDLVMKHQVPSGVPDCDELNQELLNDERYKILRYENWIFNQSDRNTGDRKICM